MVINSVGNGNTDNSAAINGEEKLVKKAAKGDTAAFEQLVLMYQKKVYSMALRMTGNPEDAQDLAQEAFLRVYRSLPGFKGEAKFSTWLYRIVSNLCIDFGRRKKSVISIYTQDESGEERELVIEDESYSPEKEYDKAETAEIINRAVMMLSEQHREIFLMRELYGLSYSEIAKATGLEDGTVKSRIFRAREKLRDILSSSGNIPDEYTSK